MRVVTLNCYLNPRSVTAGVRLHLIARELKRLQADVVLLQEVVTKGYRRWLEKFLHSLGYTCFSEEGAWFTRGGLLTAVRGTIISSMFTPFAAQGSWVGLVRGDRLLGKGYHTLRVSIGDKFFTIINTHLLAHYGVWRRLAKNKHLVAQANELTEHVAQLDQQCEVIVGGDLNFSPDTTLYQNFISRTKLVDTMAFKTVRNRWATYTVQVLDYIMYRGTGFTPVRNALAFRTPLTLGGTKYFPSDHFGVLCDFKYT